MLIKNILSACMLAMCVSGNAQVTVSDSDKTIAKSDYRPQTSWPYLFGEFQKAELHTDDDSISVNEVCVSALYNIHLKGSLLHYVNHADGLVHLVGISPAQCVVLQGKKYVLRDGKMMQVIMRNGNTELLLHTDGNWQQLFRYQGAAYGMDMTASANEGLYNSDIAGLDRPRYDVLCQRRGDGREILLQNVYYIASAPSPYELQHGGAKVEKVSRKAFERLLNKQQLQQFRKFCKDNNLNFHIYADIEKAYLQFLEIRK